MYTCLTARYGIPLPAGVLLSLAHHVHYRLPIFGDQAAYAASSAGAST